MFAIGEAKGTVSLSKLEMPREYNLKRKGRQIFGVWAKENELYLSDEVEALRPRARNAKMITKMSLDSKNRISVPSYLDGTEAQITGCITTIQIVFN
ncbi:MAG: hypothetical protein ACI4C1_06290 [Lachnospiraceae bacterium]